MADVPSDLGPTRPLLKERSDGDRGGRQRPRRRRRQHGGAAFSGAWSRCRVCFQRIGSRETQLGFGVLREKKVRRFLAAELTSISGDFMVIAILPFAVFAVGGSKVEVAAAFGLGAFFEVLVVLFGGAVGDRFQRRNVMIAADGLRFLIQATLAILLVAGIAEFWEILVAQVLQGVGAAFFNPAMSGFVPEVAPEHRIQDAYALLTTALAAGAMLGPAMAGLLLTGLDVGWAFALDAITFATSALLLNSIRVPALPREPSSSLVGDVREGWSEFRKRTWLWVVVAEFAVLNALVFGPFQMLGASVAVESLGGVGAWTIILAASGGGRLGGGLIALFWRPRRPLFAATLVIGFWAVPLVLFATAAPVPAIASAAAIAGAALSVFSALWHTTLQNRVPEDQLSRMFSYDWLGSLGLLPLGYVIAWGGEALFAAEATFIAAAVIVVVATAIVVSLPAIHGMRRSERPRPLILAQASEHTT